VTQVGISGERHAVLQIHPSRRCPLQCLHCYSESGPGQRDLLRTDAINDLIDDAAGLGYRTLAVSGGEPLSYPHLPAVIAHARARGMRVTLTTSGVTMTEAWADRLAKEVELVAVSVDGPPDVHNALRGAGWAFDRMAAALALLRAAGARFGVLNTVAASSWPSMPWVAEFAHEAGCALTQFHPLEPDGRARESLGAQVPGAVDLGRAWLIAMALEAHYSGLMQVHFDGCLRDTVLRYPDRFYAGAECAVADLASALPVLVLEADGTLVPAAHGISRSLALGNINESRLKDTWKGWLAAGYPRFRQLAGTVFCEVKDSPHTVALDWHTRLAAASRQMPVEA
jgi:Fe-coproporphyrin III synthase